MAVGSVHIEVFVRKYPDSTRALMLATEARSQARDEGNALMKSGQVAAVRVTRETLDPETGEYHPIVILDLGVPEGRKKEKVKAATVPVCVSPQDHYTCHARERIGRLLDQWLERRQATPFELLH